MYIFKLGELGMLTVFVQKSSWWCRLYWALVVRVVLESSALAFKNLKNIYGLMVAYLFVQFLKLAMISEQDNLLDP